MSRIEVRVSQDKKREWEAFVSESGAFSSLSALVRIAVSEYLKEEDEDTRLEEELLSQLARLRDELSEVDRQVARTRGDILDEDELVSLLNDSLSTYLEPVYRSDMEVQPPFQSGGDL
jgi:Arc/MetJ-type ribon-helix-helix transcriptional regulator